MNRYRLSKAGVSVGEGIRRFGGNAEKYEQLLARFQEDGHFEAMCEAIARGDAGAAFAAAHALKGVTGNLSMNRLYQDLFPLVEALRAGSLADAEALLAPARQDYAELAAALNQ